MAQSSPRILPEDRQPERRPSSAASFETIARGPTAVPFSCGPIHRSLIGNSAVIHGNVAAVWGGAIRTAGTLNVSDTTLANNVAQLGTIVTEGRTIITRSTLSGNRAEIGPGVYAVGSYR